ncbi:hypothetical protein L1987_05929 [Smallanthus sonchifolius]|uniref:Uncharacterized protein n=1 Tax=Smallanthus sonchifolius TaxID=185202 RepID=A0ACB9JWS2_9ASTR|nr:hypothetical protein L1987_05929 [Smallanthus sonchifolius]
MFYFEITTYEDGYIRWLVGLYKALHQTSLLYQIVFIRSIYTCNHWDQNSRPYQIALLDQIALYILHYFVRTKFSSGLNLHPDTNLHPGQLYLCKILTSPGSKFLHPYHSDLDNSK